MKKKLDDEAWKWKEKEDDMKQEEKIRKELSEMQNWNDQETWWSWKERGVLTNAPPTRSKLRTPPQDFNNFVPQNRSQRGGDKDLIMEPDP